MATEIYYGDARKVIWDKINRSVDCIVTSPPYWQVRDYGTEPLIWNNNFSPNGSCTAHGKEHDWVEHIEPARGGVGKNSYIGACKDGATNNRGHPTKSWYCSKCGWWKGQLGLEPKVEEYIWHVCDVFDEAKMVLKNTGSLWVNIGDTYSTNDRCGVTRKCKCMIPERFALEMCKRGWILRDSIVWKKGNNPMPENVRDRFTAKSYEMCYRFTRAQSGYYFNTLMEGDHRMRDVWNIPLKPSKDGHPATFPVELAERMIVSSCPPHGTVLDPFCGSGTTGEACWKLDMDFIGIELNPDFKPIINEKARAGHTKVYEYGKKD